MPFEKGHTLATGKPKRSSNKSTEIVKRNVALLLENNIQVVEDDLYQMSPRDIGNALLEFKKFVIPTLKSIEVEYISQADADRKYLLQLLEVPEEKFD